MVESRVSKYWWAVVATVSVIAVALIAAFDRWAPTAAATGTAVALSLMGASFLWAYATDAAERWWAIIPGLSLFTVVAAIGADALVGTDPSNDWASVLVIGVGAAVIGAALNRPSAKSVLYIVAAFSLGVGALMAPMSTPLKVVFVVVDVVVAVVVLRANRGQPLMPSRGELRPHS